ncbi:hypothetical protein HK097_010562 [Rhizophlyctis rosea]|uniref:Uncharacterized protein n=1 Tax=Rhizophlyctis rosea TaxID=64517 RepID=A0AAD5X331_9FUNG|nr:hypothetical protein HK097_010562 [Rhizophlyctis rosea]
MAKRKRRAVADNNVRSGNRTAYVGGRSWKKIILKDSNGHTTPVYGAGVGLVPSVADPQQDIWMSSTAASSQQAEDSALLEGLKRIPAEGNGLIRSDCLLRTRKGGIQIQRCKAHKGFNKRADKMAAKDRNERLRKKMTKAGAKSFKVAA